VKHKRTLFVSLLGILLVSSIVIGLVTMFRISALSVYAQQLRVGQDGTSLEMTLYSYPEQIHPVFDLFEYFKTERLQWNGILPQPTEGQGPTGEIGLNVSFVEFKKLNTDNYKLGARDLRFQLSAEGVVDAFIQARRVDATLTFWNYGELPALNLTAILNGTVIVRLSTSLLPLPGFQFVAYEYQGPLYIIRICVITPIQVTLDSPAYGETVRDNVPVKASVKTAPGIKVKHTWWFADGPRHYEGDMNYDEGTGTAEAMWETWRGPDGEYWVKAKAEGYQEGVQGPIYYAMSPTIKVYVENPPIHVTSWVWNQESGQYERYDGIKIQWWGPDGKQGEFLTPFDLRRWREQKLEAPGEWNMGEGKRAMFQRWVISDGDPNNGWVWEHGGTGMGIDDWMLETLYGRQLQCLYVPG